MKDTRAWIGVALMTGVLFSLPIPPAGAVTSGRAAATTRPSVSGGESGATIKIPVTPGQHTVSLQVPAAPGNLAAPDAPVSARVTRLRSIPRFRAETAGGGPLDSTGRSAWAAWAAR